MFFSHAAPGRDCAAGTPTRWLSVTIRSVLKALRVSCSDSLTFCGRFCSIVALHLRAFAMLSCKNDNLVRRRGAKIRCKDVCFNLFICLLVYLLLNAHHIDW